MANKKTSEESPASTLIGTEQIRAVQGGGNVYLTPNQLKTYTSSITNWDMSTNAFPTGGVNGQRYKGFEATTRTTLVDESGNILPSRVMLTYIGNGSTYSVTDFIITPILF